MEWKKFSDEILPLYENLLIGTFLNPYYFSWDEGKVYRPYNEDKKYNPDYYYYITVRSSDEKTLYPDTYWMEIENPYEII